MLLTSCCNIRDKYWQHYFIFGYISPITSALFCRWTCGFPSCHLLLFHVWEKIQSRNWGPILLFNSLAQGHFCCLSLSSNSRVLQIRANLWTSFWWAVVKTSEDTQHQFMWNSRQRSSQLVPISAKFYLKWSGTSIWLRCWLDLHSTSGEEMF